MFPKVKSGKIYIYIYTSDLGLVELMWVIKDVREGTAEMSWVFTFDVRYFQRLYMQKAREKRTKKMEDRSSSRRSRGKKKEKLVGLLLMISSVQLRLSYFVTEH
jgi:hypothetical protein